MLMYINGGHEYPILVNSTGIKEQLATTGPLVGIIPDARFNIKTVCIEPGDTLVAFTDGVTEAHVRDGELFGSERLCAILLQPFSTAAELLDQILTQVNEFTGEADPYDDITLLAVRRQ
jgi:sigma-B regulation protein RsbU (phosphoserine phosphatase)